MSFSEIGTRANLDAPVMTTTGFGMTEKTKESDYVFQSSLSDTNRNKGEPPRAPMHVVTAEPKV